MQGTQTPPQTITTTIGRYLLEESIGRGGLGEVFRAHDTQLNRWVAIKRLHREVIEAGATGIGILQEARHLAALQHPNIVTVYDFLEDGDDIVVVMELLRGRTLQEIAEKAPLTVPDFVEFMRQTLGGLIAAHEIGMLHRDIKPSNLMVVELPSKAFQVKILDFGLAKIAPEPSLQTVDQSGGLMGSIFMMSPEQFENTPLDVRSDLYSLGCVAYFALTSSYPFQGDTVPEVICAHLQQRFTPLRQLRQDIPPGLAQWITNLMALSPDARPPSAAIALQTLNAAMVAPLAPPPPFRPPRPPVPSVRAASSRPAPTPQRRSSVGGWIVGVSLAVVLAAAAFLWTSSRPKAGGASGPVGVTATVTAVEGAPPAHEKSGETVLRVGETTRAEFVGMAGQDVIVEGRVEREGVNKSGTIRFLNFHGMNRGDLSLVFFVKDAPSEFTAEGLARYVGQSIRVRGQVSLYEGNPQINISSLFQIETL